MWPTNQQASLPHGLEFVVRRTRRTLGTSFVHCNGRTKTRRREHSFALDANESSCKVNVSVLSANPPREQQILFVGQFDRDGEMNVYLPLMAASSEPSEYSEFSVPHSLNGSLTWLTGVEFTNTEAHLYHAFINGFVESVSPQLAHTKLRPAALFVPLAVENPLVKESFLACGAAFLAKSDPSFAQTALMRYSRCLFEFNNKLQGSLEEWQIATALLFCLRDKFMGSRTSQPTIHLTKALQLLKELHKSQRFNPVTIKLLVESFMFNYTVMLITAGRHAQQLLPSPFTIFDEWRAVLHFRPYECPVPWMNNPLFGAAIGPYEVAAKVSWLVARYPLCQEDMLVAYQLLSETRTYQAPTFPESAKKMYLPDERRQLMDSVVIAVIVIKLCQLLLVRLINGQVESLHPSIQMMVADIQQAFDQLLPTSSLWVICGWPLLIVGLNSCDHAHRSYVIAQCHRTANRFHAEFFLQIANFLLLAWGTDDAPGEGWKLLFDQDMAQTICI